MWLGHRSATKQTYPGKLDNLVNELTAYVSLGLIIFVMWWRTVSLFQAAGGLAASCGVKQTMVKECEEEACIPACIAEKARPVGTVRSANMSEMKTNSLNLSAIPTVIVLSFRKQWKGFTVNHFSLFCSAYSIYTYWLECERIHAQHLKTQYCESTPAIPMRTRKVCFQRASLCLTWSYLLTSSLGLGTGKCKTSTSTP